MLEKTGKATVLQVFVKTQEGKDVRHKSGLVPGLPALRWSCHWY